MQSPYLSPVLLSREITGQSETFRNTGASLQHPATAIAASHYAISNLKAFFIALSSIPRGINENAQAWTAWGQ